MIASLPTWIMTNAMTPFMPSTHPWKWRWFTLSEWAVSRTPLTILFDTLAWTVIIPSCVLAMRLYLM